MQKPRAWRGFIRTNIFSVFRPAKESDAHRLFDWANDPTTRAMSRSQDPIPWESHYRWFMDLLFDPERVLWIWQEPGRPPEGSIRFTSTGDGHAWVACQVAPASRDRGLGGRILAEGTALYAEESGRVIDGFVKTDNIPCLRATRAAGYRELGERDDGLVYFEYQLQNRSAQA